MSSFDSFDGKDFHHPPDDKWGISQRQEEINLKL
jgi:hypothetical protein